jgi:hypothetical protein
MRPGSAKALIAGAAWENLLLHHGFCQGMRAKPELLFI